MRRLTAICAAWVVVAALAWAVVPTFGGGALAQGLADVRTGNEAFRQGDYAAAVTAYTDAIRSGELVGEALAITYNNRGVAYGEAGDFESAIADYSQALALRPGDATTIRNLRVAHVRRGEVLFASGSYDAAIADFDAAIEMQADHYLAYLRRGELYAERGELDLARADLEQAAALNPGDPEIIAALERAESREPAAVAADEPGKASPPETATASAPAASEAPVAAAEPVEAAEPEPAAAPATTAEAAPPATETADGPVVAAVPERPATPEPAPAEPAAAAADAPATTGAAVPTPAPAPAESRAAGNGETWRVVSAVNYRAGPDNDAERLGTVDAGRMVTVTGDTLGWKHVTLPNGDQGYIYKKWLEPVTP
jgi:hypothetical protein